MGIRNYDSFGNATYTYSTTPAQSDCDAAITNLTSHRSSYNSTVMSLLVNQRLGNLRDTGKFAVRASVATTLRTFLTARYPELVAAIYINPQGADPAATAAATLDALMALYIESRLYLLTGAPANLALYRRRLLQVNARRGSSRVCMCTLAYQPDLCGTPTCVQRLVAVCYLQWSSACITAAWLLMYTLISPPISHARSCPSWQ